MAIYDALAEGYQRGMARVTGLHARDIADVLALRPGDRVLDVAAGTGTLTEVLAECVGSDGLVVAVDLAARMLGIARQRLAPRYPSVCCVLGSAETLPARDQSVDAVACAFGIQHMAGPHLALREMRRVLRPGGRCAIAVWGAVGEEIKTPISEAVAALNAARPLPAPPDPWSDRERLRRWLRDGGFVGAEVRPSAGSLLVADLDEWWYAVTSGRFGDRLRALRPEQEARIRHESYRRAEVFATHTGDGWLFPSAATVAVATAPPISADAAPGPSQRSGRPSAP